MTADKWGAKQDALDEMIFYTLRQLHEVGECEGAPVCGYCLDEIAEAKRENDNG